jgi:hypothetical protein
MIIWHIQTGLCRGVVRDKHPEIGVWHLFHEGEPATALRWLQQLVFQDFHLRDLGIICAPDTIPAVRMLLEERDVGVEDAVDVRRQLIDLTPLITGKLSFSHGWPLLYL